MNIVFSHIDSRVGGFVCDNRYSFNNIPEYAIYAIKQARFISPSSKIFLICVPDAIQQTMRNCLDLLDVAVIDQNYLVSEKIQECSRAFSSAIGKQGLQNFFFVTLIRLFFVEELMRKLNLTDVFQLEYDNMLYMDVSKMSDVFDKDYMVMQVNKTTACVGVSYFKTLNGISKINDMMIDELKTKPKYFVSEMKLISAISRKHHNIDFLETMPIGIQHPIFDPCSYGQYLCGTNNGHPKGFIDNEHDCGRFIRDNAGQIRFTTGSEHKISVSGVEYPFVNLHIHNKNELKNMTTY